MNKWNQNNFPLWLLLIINFFVTFECSRPSIAIVLLTQAFPPHDEVGESLKRWLLGQEAELDLDFGNTDFPVLRIQGIVLSHELKSRSSWTGTLLVERFSDADWLFLGTERTRLDLIQMSKAILFLERDPLVDPFYVGVALSDERPTIIHHYQQNSSFLYPDVDCGVLFSRALLQRLKNSSATLGDQDFTIDPSFELAKSISERVNVPLTAADANWCCEDRRRCVTNAVDAIAMLELERTTVKKGGGATPTTQSGRYLPVSVDGIFFAVKTCSALISSRLPSVLGTWIPHTKYHAFFSDAPAPSFTPVVVLPKETAVTRGFCAKTWAIFTWYLTNQRAISWLLLADDDTLISVIRLLRLLGAYDSQKPVVLGQRYAYALHRPTGYAYPTGGAGIVLSRPAVEQIILGCPCPKPDTPDDMYLGMCLDSLQIPLVHVPEMHQARPEDYAAAMLSRQKPISFHKLWGESAIRAYRTYLSDPGENLSNTTTKTTTQARSGKTTEKIEL